MTINVIAAINNTYSIGNKGKLMFKLKTDMSRFKQLTTNSVVIMGKQTYLEINKKLPNRINVVLSRNEDYKVDGVEVLHSLEEALTKYKDENVFIIGGQNLFHLGVPLADKVYLTLINDNTCGDRIFPYDYVKQHFNVASKEIHNEDGYEFEFIDYARKEDKNGKED